MTFGWAVHTQDVSGRDRMVPVSSGKSGSYTPRAFRSAWKYGSVGKGLEGSGVHRIVPEGQASHTAAIRRRRSEVIWFRGRESRGGVTCGRERIGKVWIGPVSHTAVGNDGRSEASSTWEWNVELGSVRERLHTRVITMARSVASQVEDRNGVFCSGDARKGKQRKGNNHADLFGDCEAL